MSKHSRDKGGAGEREFARLVETELGVRLKRNLEQSREGGHDLLIAEAPAPEWWDRFAVEVKRYRSGTDADVNAWWQQAVQQALRVERLALLAYRLDRRQWRLCLPLEYFTGEPEHTALLLNLPWATFRTMYTRRC